MFEQALIYNPAFGTEENVDPQLVHKWCAEGQELSQAEGVRLIGVVQGIAELAFSYGGEPVKWYKVGSGAAAKLMIVVPLATSSENWRLGFWFAGQLPLPRRSWLTPGMIHTAVGAVFAQHELTHGRIPAAAAVDPYWHAFVAGLNAVLGSRPAVAALSLAPAALRMAPGTLDPTTAHAIDELRSTHGAQDVLVTTGDDLAAIYAGKHLGLPTRRAIQRWLYFQCQRPIQSPELKNEQSVSQNEPQNELRSEPQNGPQHDPAAPTSPESDADKYRTHQAGSWWSLPSVSLPSVSLPSVPLPSVSLPSMPSVALPSLASISPVSLESLPLAGWLNSGEPEYHDGFVCDAVLTDLDTGEPLHVSVWRQALYVYTVVSPAAPGSPGSLAPLFEALAMHLEGFSFAFAPPTPFYYLIVDPRCGKMVNTFPPSDATLDAFGSLVEFERAGPEQVVRLGSTWLYFTALETGVRAVLGKKNAANQPAALLGEFQGDIHQWLEEYIERGVLQ